MNTPPSSSRLGIWFMLAGMFLISVNDMLVKVLSGDYPLHQLVFVRSALGIAISVAFLHLEGGWALLRTGRVGLHALRALLVVLANSALYAALVAMPIATASAIYFVAPLFVTLLSIPVLGEQVGARRLLAVMAGFGGVLLVVGAEMSGEEAAIGWAAILPVVAAAGYAGMSVLTRLLGQQTRASALALQLQIAFLGVSVLFWLVAGDGRFVSDDSNPSVVFLLRAWVWPAPGDWVPMLALGAISGLVGYAMSQAYRLSRASAVAPFEYVLLIFALFWGWMVFGEWPQPVVFVGAAVIIGAGVYVFLREDRDRVTRRA